MTKLNTDYLVIGSGAMGMAFTDVLLTETNARVVMVDRHHQPGGHWNDAYPHVRLHQPSSFYGVNSRKLGGDSIDAIGWNKGLYELATNSEVCAYFDQVMQQRFLASGRVEYLPLCEYVNGHVHSLVTDKQYDVAARKLVDATYMNVRVPSIQAPGYTVAEGVHCVPPNALSKLASTWKRFVVIGAGKTGMDACLFLLKHEVDPARIVWIVPRDAWLFDRANIQTDDLHAQSIGRSAGEIASAIGQASSLADMFARLGACGQLLRVDDTVRPTMWRCATVTHAELLQLRRIREVVRLGRVQRIDADAIMLDQGTLPTNASTLHIDCSADGLARRPIVPVFGAGKITLQSVRTCQQVFSAAFIAHVEASFSDDAQKNSLCAPVPHPDAELDYLRTSIADLSSGARWAEHPELQTWLAESRLYPFSRPGFVGPPTSDERAAVSAMAHKLQSFLDEA